IDGGDGNDRITGSRGNDKLIGGDGKDVVTGGIGSDVAFLGAGGGAFILDPGDGSGVGGGPSGFDTPGVKGANIAEHFSISANGSRAQLTRDVGAVTMDLNGIELIQLDARNGADNVTVNDLKGTSVKQVEISLSVIGADDGATDNVIVNANTGNNR